jgi:hypothetical protein
MQLPSISQPLPDANLTVSPKTSLVLQIGDVVQAEVLTVTDTAVAIRMKGNLLEARTNVPLREGETITLMVEGNGDEIRLRLLRGGEGNGGSIQNALLSALNTLKGLRPVAEDVKLLNALMNTMPGALKEMLPGLSVLEKLMASLDGLSGGVLKNAIRDSGVYLETKLRLLVMAEGRDDPAVGRKLTALIDGDMKAALLSLKQSLGNSDVVGRLFQNNVKADTLMSAVDNLLKNMELLQLQSRLSDTLQVFVPFLWQDLRDGELIFRESGREGAEQEAYSCTVNLDLERAGRMSARVLLQSGQIHADVSAESDRFFRLLQEGASLLREHFESAGIKLGTLMIRHQPGIDFKMSEAGGLNIRV